MFLEKYQDAESLIVIAPRGLKRLLLSEKVAIMPLLDLKIYSKEDLLEGLSFKPDARMLVETKKHLSSSFDVAEEYLALLPLLSIAKEGVPSKFQGLIDHLREAGLIVPRPSFQKLFQGKKAVVMGYLPLDKDLAMLLGRLEVPYSFEEGALNVKETPVHGYFDAKTEAMFLFEQVMSDLERKKISSPREVNLLVPSAYYPEMRRLSLRYGLPVNGLEEAKLASFPLYREFKRAVEEGNAVKNAYEALPKNESSYQERKVLGSLLASLSPFHEDPIFLELLDHEAQRKSLRPISYADGINIVGFDEAVPYLPHLYVIGFNAPAFPPAQKDDGLLSSEEKERMGVNGAVDENQIAAETTKKLLHIDSDRYLSLIDKNGDGKSDQPPYRPYVMVEEPIREDGLLPATADGRRRSHSPVQAKFISARGKDNRRLYKEQSECADYYSDADIGYRDYDHSFKGVDVRRDGPLTLSYSGLDTYIKCPFHYYLSHVLLPKDQEYSFASAFGTLFHEAMEFENDGHIDWSKVNDKADELFQDRPLDRLLALEKARYSDKVAEVGEAYRKSSSFSDEPKRENPILIDINPNLKVKGKIDKIYFDHKNKRLAVIDYKTGQFSFALKKAEKGYQLQLPTYYLLSKEAFPDYEVAGLFIQSIKGFGVGKENPFKFEGIFLDEEETMTDLDTTLEPGDESRYVSGLKMKKEGDFAKSSRRISQIAMEELAKKARAYFEKNAEAIGGGDFEIAPKKIDGETPCGLCPYRDICYRSEDDIVEVDNEDEEGEEDNE